jgi:hypothetical protein
LICLTSRQNIASGDALRRRRQRPPAGSIVASRAASAVIRLNFQTIAICRRNSSGNKRHMVHWRGGGDVIVREVAGGLVVSLQQILEGVRHGYQPDGHPPSHRLRLDISVRRRKSRMSSGLTRNKNAVPLYRYIRYNIIGEGAGCKNRRFCPLHVIGHLWNRGIDFRFRAA